MLFKTKHLVVQLFFFLYFDVMSYLIMTISAEIYI
jgi:hypothetical protein